MFFSNEGLWHGGDAALTTYKNATGDFWNLLQNRSELPVMTFGSVIGMIANADIASNIMTLLAVCNVPVIVIPVMIAGGGSHLLDPDAIKRCDEVPIASANLPESSVVMVRPSMR